MRTSRTVRETVSTMHCCTGYNAIRVPVINSCTTAVAVKTVVGCGTVTQSATLPLFFSLAITVQYWNYNVILLL